MNDLREELLENISEVDAASPLGTLPNYACIALRRLGEGPDRELLAAFTKAQKRSGVHLSDYLREAMNSRFGPNFISPNADGGIPTMTNVGG